MAGKSTTARIPAGHGNQHHLGFNDALEQALGQLSRDVGPGKYIVNVEFSVEVNVSNPGTIGFYQVKLTD